MHDDTRAGADTRMEVWSPVASFPRCRAGLCVKAGCRNGGLEPQRHGANERLHGVRRAGWRCSRESCRACTLSQEVDHFSLRDFKSLPLRNKKIELAEA